MALFRRLRPRGVPERTKQIVMSPTRCMPDWFPGKAWFIQQQVQQKIMLPPNICFDKNEMSSLLESCEEKGDGEACSRTAGCSLQVSEVMAQRFEKQANVENYLGHDIQKN
jgi:hypothetical protein